MKFGYARTSTTEQHAGLEAQKRMLAEYGCAKIVEEQVSSVAVRDRFNSLIEFVREGDLVVVTKLDRAFRSVEQAVHVVKQLEEKRVGLVILDLGGQPVDLRTPTGKLIFNVMVSIAQFEREVMLERQREGVAKARAEKRYTGRKPTIDPSQVKALLASGLSYRETAKRLGIALSSVQRLA